MPGDGVAFGGEALTAPARQLLTVAEFARLPRAAGVRQELHHGELVSLPPVKKLHTKIHKRLQGLLEGSMLPSDMGVDKEFPFRPAPEYEVWVAGVAVFSLAVWEQTADDDYYHGVPAIVIEVLSPSNTASEMLEREEICLRHGGLEFWMADPKRESVKVIRAGGSCRVYGANGVLESAVLKGPIPVGEIFGRV